MAQDRNIAFIPLKHFLFLVAIIFAVSATLLLIFFTSAATATGSNPSTAISLTDGVNTGILGPGEQRWFRIVPTLENQIDSAEKNLALTFTPSNNEFVALQLFEQGESQIFNFDDVSQLAELGVGQAVFSDSNPETGELLWRGRLFNDRTYFIQLLNNSDFPLDYWLTAENAVTLPAPVPVVPVDIQVETPVEEPPAVVAVPEMGIDPGNPAPLASDLNTGSLKPGEIRWYAFSQTDLSNNNQIQDLNFSMFFTPADGNRGHQVNFELFSANEVENWWRDGHEAPHNFGAGMLVSRDGDFNTGERMWQGSVVKGDTYYLAVQNDTAAEVDYWLFSDDIYRPELGTPTDLAPAPVFAQGAAPQTSFPLDSAQNVGGLAPDAEAWYSFSIADNDDESFEEMALTMIVTPDDGNRIRNVTFDVFTAEGVRTWSPGNPEGINNVGAGSVVYRDNNHLTGERFWSGWVVDNDLYYVRVRNGSDVFVDYWLFNGDVYRPELGQFAAGN